MSCFEKTYYIKMLAEKVADMCQSAFSNQRPKDKNRLDIQVIFEVESFPNFIVSLVVSEITYIKTMKSQRTPLLK
jgi:hypothetical protein